MPRTSRRVEVRNALKDRYHCATCPHFHQPEGRGKTGLCVAHPPQAILVAMAPQNVIVSPEAQRLQPVVQTFYPPVSDQHGCHEHPQYLVDKGLILRRDDLRPPEETEQESDDVAAQRG